MSDSTVNNQNCSPSQLDKTRSSSLWPERKGDGQSPEEYGLKNTDAYRGTDRGGI